MSSNQAIGAVILAALAGLAWPGAASAQDDVAARVADILDQAKRVYSVADRPSGGGCAAEEASSPGEIVVCARAGADDQRVASSADDDPDSRAARHALSDGAPRTPWVSNLADCSREKCMRIGRAPPPLYLIDVTALPSPPPGSDAEAIASGERRGD